MGQVLPRAESCDNDDTDDDCNGVEDDVPGVGNPCIASEQYGLCREGMVQCADKPSPECMPGEPSKERCDELDWDCDGDPTNTFDLNNDEETCGACDVQCGSSETCCEGSCIDEGSLGDDVNNCGACGVRCGLGLYCCQGECLSAQGPMAGVCACTSDCGDKSCCGDKCRDLQADEAHCGACGRKCAKNQSCVSGVCRDDR